MLNRKTKKMREDWLEINVKRRYIESAINYVSMRVNKEIVLAFIDLKRPLTALSRIHCSKYSWRQQQIIMTEE